MNLKQLLFWWIDFSEKNDTVSNGSTVKEPLHIDKDVFLKNLRVTQQYCDNKFDAHPENIARVYRTINPVTDTKPLFDFKLECFEYGLLPGIKSYTSAVWSINHWEPQDRMRNIFEEQMKIKYAQQYSVERKIYEGDILISEFDGCVVDGASEVESLGLIDGNDMPPIDTWFYILKTRTRRRLLFAWIPKEAKYYANEAILVNCVDCINWFQEWYPNEYKKMME